MPTTGDILGGLFILALILGTIYLMWYYNKDSIAIRAINKAQSLCIAAYKSGDHTDFNTASAAIMEAQSAVLIAIKADGGNASSRLAPHIVTLSSLKCNTTLTNEQNAVNAVEMAKIATDKANQTGSSADVTAGSAAITAAGAALKLVIDEYASMGAPLPQVMLDTQAKLRNIILSPPMKLITDVSAFQSDGSKIDATAVPNQPMPAKSNYVGPLTLYSVIDDYLLISIVTPNGQKTMFNSTGASIPSRYVGNPANMPVTFNSGDGYPCSGTCILQITNVPSGSTIIFKIGNQVGACGWIGAWTYNGRIYTTNALAAGTIGMSAVSANQGNPRDGIPNGRALTIVNQYMPNWSGWAGAAMEDLFSKAPITNVRSATSWIGTLDNARDPCDPQTRICSAGVDRPAPYARDYIWTAL